jgi:surfeit locus 1 family protein
LAGLCLAGVIGLIALGVWQLERRTWKLALIDRVDRRVHASPQPIPAPAAWPAINAAGDEYRRVTVTGQFMHEREALVQAVTDDGRGFWVVRPLRTASGDVVLVNRGFVPPERRAAATRGEGDPQAGVTVTGLLRMTEPKGAFLRTNDPASDRWYSRDVAAIAAARGLSQVAPFFIDADATPNAGGYPIGGLTVIAFPNNHLIYALTWFALAFMLTGAYLRIVRGTPSARISSHKAASDAEACIHSA